MSTRSVGDPVSTGGGAAVPTGRGLDAIATGADVTGAGEGETDGNVAGNAVDGTGESVGCAAGAKVIAGAGGSGCVRQLSRGNLAAGNSAS